MEIPRHIHGVLTTTNDGKVVHYLNESGGDVRKAIHEMQVDGLEQSLKRYAGNARQLIVDNIPDCKQSDTMTLIFLKYLADGGHISLTNDYGVYRRVLKRHKFGAPVEELDKEKALDQIEREANRSITKLQQDGILKRNKNVVTFYQDVRWGVTHKSKNTMTRSEIEKCGMELLSKESRKDYRKFSKISREINKLSDELGGSKKNVDHLRTIYTHGVKAITPTNLLIVSHKHNVNKNTEDQSLAITPTQYIKYVLGDLWENCTTEQDWERVDAIQRELENHMTHVYNHTHMESISRKMKTTIGKAYSSLDPYSPNASHWDEIESIESKIKKMELIG